MAEQFAKNMIFPIALDIINQTGIELSWDTVNALDPEGPSF